jgi:hypothetical protein
MRLVNEEATQRQECWRGMNNLELSEDFHLHGGVELGCLSTTSNKELLGGYFKSEQPFFLMCIVSDDFMRRGVAVSWLSLYPREAEVLYPPLTYLKYVNTRVIKDSAGVIVDVVPSWP